MKTMEDVYYGASLESDANGTVVNFYENAPRDNPNAGFRKSAFNQAMRNDLRRSFRVAERLMDMSTDFCAVDNDRVIATLEGMGVDCEQYRLAITGNISTDSVSVMQEEKVTRLNDKINAIQKEIDIETKIQDGIIKMSSAKHQLSYPPSAASKMKPNAEMSSQTEISMKKLEALQQELHRCKLQLAAVLTAASTSPPASTTTGNNDDTKQGSHKDEEVIKVTFMDVSGKTSSTSAFIVSPNTTTGMQLITLAVLKFRLPGVEYDYSLTYKGAHGDDIPIMYDDVLNRSGADFSANGLKLSSKVGKLWVPVNSKDEPLSGKQGEVLREIIETEKAYAEDLKTIVQNFLNPTESIYRINYIEENMDFGGVTEKFKIANGRRELISERTFTYTRRNATNTLDVVAMLFSDIILLVKAKREQFQLYRPPVPLESCVIIDAQETTGIAILPCRALIRGCRANKRNTDCAPST
ncbi:hypothetical protein HK101_008112 [Irineochytrium annulatum]|nr:hypothetical protein HK101_008112 [Irineochytrium annulatum]